MLARHDFQVEYIANLLKGEATKQLRQEGLDPLSAWAQPGQRPHSPWCDRRWKVYLDSEQAMENAIRSSRRTP